MTTLLTSLRLPVPAPVSPATDHETEQPEDEQDQRHPKECLGHESQAEEYSHQDEEQNQSEHRNLLLYG
jgi:hypothetical protein